MKHLSDCSNDLRTEKDHYNDLFENENEAIQGFEIEE